MLQRKQMGARLPRVVNVIAVIVAFSLSPAMAQERIGTIFDVKPIEGSESCAGEGSAPCAFISSQAEGCSRPLKKGCAIHDGDVLMLKNERLVFSVCRDFPRTMEFTNVLMSYTFTGDCNIGVTETVSPLIDEVRPNPAKQ